MPEPKPTSIPKQHITDIQARFFDTDAFGHISNLGFSLYAEQSRIMFLYEVAGQQGNLILASIKLDFLKQVRFGESIQVAASIEKLGNSSITLYQEVLANTIVAAKISSVVVLFDYASQKKQSLSEDLREKLERYTLK